MPSTSTYPSYSSYEQLDLNKVESFEVFIPEKSNTDIMFNHYLDYNNKESDILTGLLNNSDQEGFHTPSVATLYDFEVFLDEQYSIAVNTGYLKVKDLDNYSYAGLLNIEAEALLKSAKVFNKWAFFESIQRAHQQHFAQALVDKIYKKVLHISWFLHSNFVDRKILLHELQIR